MHPHVRKQQRAGHARTRDDAPARHHRVDRGAPAVVVVEHELRRRQLFLVGPDRPLLVVDVELGGHAHEFHVRLVVGIHRTHVAPVVLRLRAYVLERVGEHAQLVDRVRHDVAAEVVRRVRVLGVGTQQPLEQPRIEHVDAHGGERHVGAARHRRRVVRLLEEAQHSIGFVHSEHAELTRARHRHFDDADGDVGLLFDVEADHRAVVHLVDVIPGEDQHVQRPVRADDLHVLPERVGGALVPLGAALLLGRDDLDELAELAAKVAPATLDVLDQRVRLVLGEDRDLPDPGVDAVRQCEVDDPELAAERRRGLASVLGEVPQTLAAAAGHDNREGPAGEATEVAPRRKQSLLFGGHRARLSAYLAGCYRLHRSPDTAETRMKSGRTGTRRPGGADCWSTIKALFGRERYH